LSIASILDQESELSSSTSDGVGSKTTGGAAPPKDTSHLIKESGKVKHVINDNFGLVSVLNGKLALFDTYDYHLADKKTAAEAGKSLKDIVRVGMTVKFNACEINKKLGIPYLCTSVWNPSDQDIEPLARDKIQSEKLQIHEQVANSCKEMIKKLNAEAPIEKANSSLEARREQIDRVYNSRSYREYVYRIPKSRRLSRDPRTPDRNDKTISSNDWLVKVKHWQQEIEEKFGGGGGSSKRSRSPDASSRSSSKLTVDLYEHTVSGIYHKSVSSKAAIFKMNNGKRVLVDKDRIWAGDKPFTGSWNDLHNSVNIRARLVNTRYFEYQAIFGHYGYHARDKNRHYFYSGPKIKVWVEDRENVKHLDAELSAAKSRLN